MKVESRETENTRHKTPNEDKQNRSYKETEGRIQRLLDTRHKQKLQHRKLTQEQWQIKQKLWRKKTNKTEVTTQKTKTMKEESRDNIRQDTEWIKQKL